MRMPAGQPLPPMVAEVPPPKTIGDAVKQMHDMSAVMTECIARLERLAALEEQAPEMHTVTINNGNDGNYIRTHRRPFASKSIGFLNPGSAAVFVGIGGVSARPTSRAPQVPGGGALVLPVEVGDVIELGCDPTVLGTDTKVVYVFHYVTVQPLMVIGNL